MNLPKHNYFWLIDNELPEEIISEYQLALSQKPSSTLTRTIELIDKKVPLPPMAYLTSKFNQKNLAKPGQSLLEDLDSLLKRFEAITRSQFGSTTYPLLVSVQGDFCGTIRGIGMTPQNLSSLVHLYGQQRVFETYINFLETFSSLALRCPFIDFKKLFNIKTTREGESIQLSELPLAEFQKYCENYIKRVEDEIQTPFPQKPERQLLITIKHCVQVSSESGGDEIFVKTYFLPPVQDKGLNGVAFSRNPFNGASELYGTFEDVQSGTKKSISKTGQDDEASTMMDDYPTTYGALKRYLPKIEEVFQDVVEVEFVTQAGQNPFFTEFHKAAASAKATIVAAMDLNRAGIISDNEAAMRVKPQDIEVLLHPTLTDASRQKLKDLGSTGVTAAPGTAIGKIFFTIQDLIDFYQEATQNKTDTRAILVTDELTIADSAGLDMVSGLVTKASGIASHAAVMARANGIPCIVGYQGLEVDLATKTMLVGEARYPSGTLVTMEAGSDGRIYLGAGELQNLSHQEGVVQGVTQLMSRIQKEKKIPLNVYCNINNSKDAQNALSFGADGVGLCRTENMFIHPDAILEIRNIVFTQNPKESIESFEKLEALQRVDYKNIFKVMGERTVNIRLMDMPLHELVPQSEKEMQTLKEQLSHLEPGFIDTVAEGLKEHNPMLGLRACRFGIVVPQIYEMQLRAIFKAAYEVAQSGVNVNPGIMFPLVFTRNELTRLRNVVQAVESQVREELQLSKNKKINYRVGTMIELPAAALEADRLAEVGEFFAFGTNDLTQTTLGISRDDSAHFLPIYRDYQIISGDPFRELFPPVRELIETATRRGHRVRPSATFGICGEQGGDPTTILFCLEKGIQYVSCSPYRVLPAKVAVVRTALQMESIESQAKIVSFESRQKAIRA